MMKGMQGRDKNDKESADGHGDGGPFGQSHLPGVRVCAAGGHSVLNRGEGGVGGGAHGAVAHGGGVADQGHDGGGQRREAHADQQGSGQGGGSAEAGGALDESAEHPANDDSLDTGVLGHALEHAVDGGHGAGALQGIHNQDGAEDDDQSLKGAEEAGDGVGRHVVDVHLPHGKGDDTGQNPGQGQGPLGGPVEGDHQYDGHDDRDKGD